MSCSAGGGGGVQGSGGAGAGSTGGANVGGSGGEPNLTVGSGGGGGVGGGACQHLDVTFEPETPTVLILVDRSGSMFDGGYWDPLKTAVLSVVQSVQDKVRFGLLTFTGIANQTCPLLSGTDAIALGNYDAISAAYEAASVQPGAKLETPTGLVLNETVIPELMSFAEPGPKYILFVTDGEPDRCDDGMPECARDDVIGAVQSAHALGIGTLVFGLGPNTFAQHLQDIANAGAGAQVQFPSDNALNGCFGGNWANAQGQYSAAGDTTPYFTPDPTDAEALEAELTTALAGTRSCTFDLQGKIEVDVANASLGHVTIDGEAIPYDMTDGWYMASPTELVLAGAACEKLKAAEQGISFDFPCDILIPE